MKFFLIHGMHGSPNEHWHPWMKKQLRKKGHSVFSPRFPQGKKLSLSNWLKAFRPYARYVDENTVFIARSLGPAFVLRVLEKSKKKVRACFFIAGFVGTLADKKSNVERKTFFAKKFNWRKIHSNCGKFVFIASSDDPYVPLKKVRGLANKFGEKVTVVKNAGHFNTKSGYAKFPLLLKLVNKELAKK